MGAQPAVHNLFFDTRPFKAGCLRFGVATLCRCSQPWVTLGRLGWNWVDIGGRGGVEGNFHHGGTETRRNLEKIQGFTADLREGARI
jgi:hypothetical protein